LYNRSQSPLAEFVNQRLGGNTEPEETPGERRDRERQDQLKARARELSTWKRFVSAFSAGELPLTGEHLKFIREQAGLSTADVSEIVGAPVNTIEAVERGGDAGPFTAPLQQFTRAAEDFITTPKGSEDNA